MEEKSLEDELRDQVGEMMPDVPPDSTFEEEMGATAVPMDMSDDASDDDLDKIVLPPARPDESPEQSEEAPEETTEEASEEAGPAPVPAPAPAVPKSDKPDKREKVIQINHLKKVYQMGTEKVFAVRDVSFEIYEGEFCCLLGTSGSGKSTLLNLMAGIEKATAGEILIKGKNIRKMSEKSLADFRQRYLGFVFQSYNLLGSMNAVENTELPLVFKRMDKDLRRKKAEKALIEVGLKERLYHLPSEMSGGQQQRVGIARAFVADPDIVFADEPTGNLDTKTTMEVMNLIHAMARRNKQTIVMVTHDPRLADYGDKIIHILDGEIKSVEVRKTAEEIEAEAEVEKAKFAEELAEKKREKEERRRQKASRKG